MKETFFWAGLLFNSLSLHKNTSLGKDTEVPQHKKGNLDRAKVHSSFKGKLGRVQTQKHTCSLSGKA